MSNKQYRGINEAVNIATVFNHICNTDFPVREVGQFYAQCPLHDGKNLASLTLYYDTNTAHCWSEDKTFRPIDVVKAGLGLGTTGEAIDYLVKEFDLLPVTSEDILKQEIRGIWAKYVAATEGHLPTEAIQALKSRGLSEKDLTTYHIGYHSQSNDLAELSDELLETAGLVHSSINTFDGAVVLPLYLNHSLVGLQGWHYDDVGAKYVGPRGIPKPIVGEVGQAGSTTLVVEGYFDMLSCLKVGFPTISTLSTEVSRQGLAFLQEHDNLVILFDADPAGQRAGRDVATQLYPKARVADLSVLASKYDCLEDFDVNDLLQKVGPETFKTELQELIDTAEDIFDYYLDAFKDLPDDSNTTTVVEALRPLTDLIAKLPGTTWGPYVDRLKKHGSRFNLSKESIKGLIKGAAKEDKSAENTKTPTEFIHQYLLDLPHFELFRDKNGVGYAQHETGGHIDTKEIRTTSFKHYLRRMYYSWAKREATTDIIKTVMEALEAIATGETSLITLHNRTAHYPNQDTIYYDLTNEDRQVLKITKDSVEVLSTSPVPLFKRYDHQRPQVMPDLKSPDITAVFAERKFDVEQEDGTIQTKKFRLLPIEDAGTQLLVLVQLVYNLVPDVDKLLLGFAGGPGSGKTTTAETYCGCIDPAHPQSIIESSDRAEIGQQLDHRYVPCFDNVNDLQRWFARSLNTAATGAGYEARKLYTDDQSVIRSFTRHVVLTSVDKIGVEHADLLDRLQLVVLERIEDTSVDEWEKSLEEQLPHIVGGMFKTLSQAMKLRAEGAPIASSIKIPYIGRMASFVRWGSYIARALGYTVDAFYKAYGDNRALVNRELMESQSLPSVLVEYLSNHKGVCEGTPTEVHNKLTVFAEDTLKIKITKETKWPKNAGWLIRRLNELHTNLRMAGIEFDAKHGDDNRLKIWRTNTEVQENTPPKPKEEQDGKETKKREVKKPSPKPKEPTQKKSKSQQVLVEDAELPPVTNAYDSTTFNVGPDTIRLGNTVAVDIETTGLDPYQSVIKLVSVTDGRHTISLSNCQPLQLLLGDPRVTKVFHNAAFELSFFNSLGLTVENYQDTMLMAQVIFNNEGSSSLEHLANTLLDIELDKTLQKDWQSVITEEHIEYNKQDSAVTLQLYTTLQELLQNRGLETVYTKELRALPTILRLQTDGIYFDKRKWLAGLSEHKTKYEQLADRIKAELHTPDLNLNSTQQLLAVLHSQGIDIKDTKEETFALNADHYPVLGRLIEYRKLHKLITGYEKTYLNGIGPDNRIHSNFRLIGTETGRMSCSRPNLQQVHTLLKPYFKAEPGNVFVYADYSQAQLRILADMSQDAVMLQAFQDDEDIHTTTARAIFGGTEAITTEQRALAKALNFGLSFGLSSKGLRDQVKTNSSIDITVEEANAFRNQFLTTYEGLYAWQQRQTRASTVTSPWGRQWTNFATKPWTTRLNYPVQAAEAEGLKGALTLLHRELPTNWKLVNVVHDSIMLEVPKDDSEKATALLQRCMIEGMEQIVKGVPIKVDVTTNESWS